MAGSLLMDFCAALGAMATGIRVLRLQDSHSDSGRDLKAELRKASLSIQLLAMALGSHACSKVAIAHTGAAQQQFFFALASNLQIRELGLLQ